MMVPSRAATCPQHTVPLHSSTFKHLHPPVMMPALLMMVPSRATTFWRWAELKATSRACSGVSHTMVVLRWGGHQEERGAAGSVEWRGLHAACRGVLRAMVVLLAGAVQVGLREEG